MAWTTYNWACAVILLLPTHPHPHCCRVNEPVPDGVQPGHGKGSNSPGAGLDRGLPLAVHTVLFGLQGVQISGRPCHLDLRRLVGTLQLCQLLFLCCNLQAMR